MNRLYLLIDGMPVPVRTLMHNDYRIVTVGNVELRDFPASPQCTCSAPRKWTNGEFIPCKHIAALRRVGLIDEPKGE